MITGDNIFTAKAIAFECGILEPDDANIDGTVVEGQEFRNFLTQERLEKVGRIRVMARSSPFDKLLMVQCLKQKGHVAAVTGDGTNDAPALKEADVGLACDQLYCSDFLRQSSSNNCAASVGELNYGHIGSIGISHRKTDAGVDEETSCRSD